LTTVSVLPVLLNILLAN